MNIFAVDDNPEIAGRSLPDKLVVKMPTESLQLLTPWVYNTFGEKIEKPAPNGQAILPESEKKYYGIKGFAHHPCAKWLYESPSNVHWLLEHAYGMTQEYWERYNKYHGTLHGLGEIRDIVYRNFGSARSGDHTPFVQAMPDQYKNPENAVQAYRNYLIGEKGYAEWRHCQPPEWWDFETHKHAREKYLEQKKEKRALRLNAKHPPASRSLQT
jgi:hypothetical protein